MPDDHLTTIPELEKEIAKEQALLVQYEDLERLERDPRRRLFLQQNVEQVKQHILNLQLKLAELQRESTPTTALTVQETTFIANVPYGLESELFGREQELTLLDDWFHYDPTHPLLAVIGLGGQGKSALTWQWQKRLQAQQQAPPLVVWWSFYEQDGTMRALLAELLTHFGEDPTRFTHLRPAVDRLRHHLQRTPALILLDGAERLLRAYSGMGAAYQGDAEMGNVHTAGLAKQQLRQCVDPAADVLLSWLAQPGQTQARTLLTSRLFPSALAGRSGLGLAGVRRHDLTGINLDAATAMFRQLGVRATRAEVRAACEPLGYHPLSLRLLARAAHYSPTHPNDLRAAADYDPNADLLGKREHVLRRAYDNLPNRAQLTLSRLAAFRSSVAWRVLADVFGGGRPVQQDLQLLEERGLLQRTIQPNTEHRTPHTVYDLHPIVRRYAYDRLNDREGTHAQLVVYFEAVPKPQRVQTLEDLEPAIELYHHLVRAKRYDEAWVLYRDKIWNPVFYQLGAYQTQIELLRVIFIDGQEKLPTLTDERHQAHLLNELASSYSLSGKPKTAVLLLEQSSEIDENRGDKTNIATGLGNLAYQQHLMGQLTAVSDNLQRRIRLCREIEDRYREAIGHREYGRLLATIGNWSEATQEFDTALDQFKAENVIQSQGIIWANRAQAALLSGEAAIALTAAQEALRLADETARTSYPYERDYVRAHWLLGWARLALGELPAAQQHLDEALRRCRAINLVELEPSILLAQARLAVAKGLPQAGLDFAQEGLGIAQRAGYVLNLADIHNFLAQQALAANQPEAARRHAQQAHDFAWCDGPPFVYKVALDEAQRLLEALG